MKRFLDFLTIVFALVAFCILIVCIVYRFQNPDMTEMRAFLNNKWKILAMFISIALAYYCNILSESKK